MDPMGLSGSRSRFVPRQRRFPWFPLSNPMTGEKKKHDPISDITRQNTEVLRFDVWIRICFLGGIESSRVESSYISTSRRNGRDERDEPGSIFLGWRSCMGEAYKSYHFVSPKKDHSLVFQIPCELVFVPSNLLQTSPHNVFGSFWKTRDWKKIVYPGSWLMKNQQDHRSKKEWALFRFHEGYMINS